MLEFAIVAPIAVAMILMLIDFSRLVYTYAAISWASREGARLVSLAHNINTDCPALRRVELVGRGFPIVADPNSVWGNQDPNGGGSPGPTTPGGRQGEVHIFPAGATHPAGTHC